MSNRTMLEINHDLVPTVRDLLGEDRHSREARRWVDNLLTYFRTGDVDYLPDGVTWFGMRHHSEPCPLGEPPKGWNNDKTE